MRRDVNDSRPDGGSTLAAAATGSTIYLASGWHSAGRSLPVVVARLDADGTLAWTLAWTRPLPVETCEPRSAALVALEDGVVVACIEKGAAVLSIHHFDRDGAARPVMRFDAPCGARAGNDPLGGALTAPGRITLVGAFDGCAWAAALSLPGPR